MLKILRMWRAFYFINVSHFINVVQSNESLKSDLEIFKRSSFFCFFLNQDNNVDSFHSNIFRGQIFR